LTKTHGVAGKEWEQAVPLCSGLRGKCSRNTSVKDRKQRAATMLLSVCPGHSVNRYWAGGKQDYVSFVHPSKGFSISNSSSLLLVFS